MLPRRRRGDSVVVTKDGKPVAALVDYALAAPGEPIRPPILLPEMSKGRILGPDVDDRRQLAGIPDWAKPVLEAAIRFQKPP
jgi:antitoxin (DNA-binding transcriptional repressor) of toxin-antitoxin stability system